MSTTPRGEYPRPQFRREEWLCLNGEWQFEIDQGDSGLERGLLERSLERRIAVPFCPEAPLSGVGEEDFLGAVWYRREVSVPAGWAGRDAVLHFQAVDYDSTVWVNGTEVVRHRGGFTPFSANLGDIVAAGETATVVVRARDTQDRPQPRGKQAQTYGPAGAIYKRTTGIWQSVWMEPLPASHLGRTRITPDVEGACFLLQQPVRGVTRDMCVRAVLSDPDGPVAEAQASVAFDLSPRLRLAIPEERLRLWSPADPFLYDLRIELVDDDCVLDRVDSYAGLRGIAIDGNGVRLNGEIVFQRLVLDQGYYPDGIMTAPDDAALVRDIELSKAAGFNGARLHQKVFEERFLYHADRLGYLVWGEFGDWGCRGYGPSREEHQKPGSDYITQWLEALERDYSHPSIVGWCPLNETWQVIGDRITDLDDVTRGMFLAAKAMDTTRPVLDASGYSHRVPEADIYDSHDYTQDADELRSHHAGLADGQPFVNRRGDLDWSIPYRGQPFFVSEFGGIWWNPEAAKGEDSWGYGERPKTIDEFYERFERLCAVLLDDPNMFAYCYTQLTDIYQEQNGIVRFDRSGKFDLERLRAVQTRTAAIERRDTE